jgi:hypothetical protein
MERRPFHHTSEARPGSLCVFAASSFQPALRAKSKDLSDVRDAFARPLHGLGIVRIIASPFDELLEEPLCLTKHIVFFLLSLLFGLALLFDGVEARWGSEEERDPVTHYGWAVEVEMTEGRWQAALRHLERARELNTEPQLFEPWIEAWIDNQEGAIALRRRQPDLARKHFDRAARLLRRPEVARFAANEWARSERGD